VVKIRQEPNMKVIVIFTLVICGIGVESLAEKLVEYVKVTSEIGTAYASSEYKGRTGFEADKAFGEDGYWCSVRGPDMPVRLWFQFKEPKRVVQIKFEEQYEMSGEDGYEVFGSDAVGDCGGPNKQNVLTEAAASEFVTGKEFKNARFFYCYGIQTNSSGRNDYVSAKKLKFGFEGNTCCKTAKCADYRGTIAVTEDGHTCKDWVLSNNYKPSDYPNGGLIKNYCRNPRSGTHEKAWCYTTTSWGWCDIPQCQVHLCSFAHRVELDQQRREADELVKRMKDQDISWYEWVGCGELYGKNPGRCRTNCGFSKWTCSKSYPCDATTNRNYGCNEQKCFRSDNDEPWWCYTEKSCGDGNHETCMDQVLSPCQGCGELYGTNLDTCGTDCGFKEWTVDRGDACDSTTNRNYGCYREQCWRSDADKTRLEELGRKWCHTHKTCEDGNHESCKDQVESPCGCGKKEWDDLHYGCEESNNRNYGCDHNHACWRSDENDPRGWCFTGEFCDYEDDYHQGCQKVKYNDRPHRKGTLQTELPCGEPYYRIESWKKAGPGAPNGE